MIDSDEDEEDEDVNGSDDEDEEQDIVDGEGDSNDTLSLKAPAFSTCITESSAIDPQSYTGDEEMATDTEEIQSTMCIM